MILTRSDAEQIAEELVSVTHYPTRGVWIVKFGVSLEQYQLMYDTQEVAEGIAGALKQLVIRGIEQAQKLQERY